MAVRLTLKFFLDHCVPHSVGVALASAGHDVVYQKDVIAQDSPDQLVAATSELLGAILVSFDHDFKRLASKTGISQSRLKKLSRIALNCSEPQAAERITKSLSLIEREWAIAQEASDKRMIIGIGNSYIRTER